MDMSYVVILAPLFAAALTALFGDSFGRRFTHLTTSFSVFIALVVSCILFYQTYILQQQPYYAQMFSWLEISELARITVGVYVGSLSSLMMIVVCAVSLCVHIFSIGYMEEDESYNRFFTYIAFFTFSMLTLVAANNFLQLFIGWEAVGLSSYLLIGFWYTKPSATTASLKAFLVNRISDIGLVLGVAAVFYTFNTFEFDQVFNQISTGASVSVINMLGFMVSPYEVIAILLFIGAMGKSAQFPLHVWLPDSMEGPTPISALIHAATMVTAGVFMVVRLAPVYEQAEFARLFILSIGTITAISMGFVAILQYDIKRIVAYSTISQLGYMVIGLGVSAYSASIFHLVTHAFFKALMFLVAGSVILALHHKQDVRKMGGLRKKMPISSVCAVIASLALVGFPGTSGFFSKEIIIEAVHHSSASSVFYYLALFGVLLTSIYSFRFLFIVFFGEHRMPDEEYSHVHEPAKVITVPLMLLAIPSLIGGAVLFDSIILDNALDIAAFADSSNPLVQSSSNFNDWVDMLLSVFKHPMALLLVLIGAGAAWLITKFDSFSEHKPISVKGILSNGYYINELYATFIVQPVHVIAHLADKAFDKALIDTVIVNGTAFVIEKSSRALKKIQTGYVYHYLLAMFLFVVIFGWMAIRNGVTL
ncbi:MAG: NADH-quinone oxidoreductase subunit L [Gammaproteobacteria bacterium]|nr:MAG: NADH-quinone oxidoreductase subunit L [Gammaproteobacteria bacterium]